MNNNRASMGLVLAAFLGASAQAQEPAKKGVENPPQELLSADQRLEELVTRFQAKQNEVYEAYGKATTDEERQEILEGLPGAEFVPEFRTLAEEFPGTDAAAHAWIWVLRLVQDENKDEALRTLDVLITQYLKSEALDKLTSELRYASSSYGEERVVEALWTIAEGSPHKKVQAAALFTLGAIQSESTDAAKQAEGRKLFERIVAEYADVDYWGRGTYGKEAAGFLFELDHLQIGMAAPDVDLTDENGVAFRLSDYRGKVMIVDFWGFW